MAGNIGRSCNASVEAEVSDTAEKPQTPADAPTNTLPRLYTLREVHEATQYGAEKLRRVLVEHPEVPRVGTGRGTRLTYEGYMQLLIAGGRMRHGSRFMRWRPDEPVPDGGGWKMRIQSEEPN